MKKFTELSLTEYLSQLASTEPVPGGGSVSAYVASLAMGLTQMVGRISLTRKPKAGSTPEELAKDQEQRASIQKIVDLIEQTKKDAFQIVDIDPQIFQKVMSAPPEHMEDALENSFRLQAELTLLVVMAREWNAAMAGLVKGSIKNDLLVAAALYEAAYHGAYHTAMINVKYMKDAVHKERSEKAMAELEQRFKKGNPS